MYSVFKEQKLSSIFTNQVLIRNVQRVQGLKKYFRCMQLWCHWNNSMSHVLNQIQSQETCFILCNMYILKNNSFYNVRHWYRHYKYANKSYSWVIKITTPKKAICVSVGVQFETNIKILYFFSCQSKRVIFF